MQQIVAAMGQTDKAIVDLQNSTNTTVNNINNYPQQIAKQLNSMNISGFNIDIYSKLPQ
jgi:hypothetical protein